MDWKIVLTKYGIKGVKTDSRKVTPGDVFVAYGGVEVDGHDYIDQAIKNGASLVVGEKELNCEVPYIRVKNGRLAWSQLVAQLYNHPEGQLKIIGVTGTDGKTTTTNLIYQILKTAGKKVSMTSTINAVVGSQSFDTGLHTSSPDPDKLWEILSLMVKDGSEYAVLEATSHGLAQERFGDIEFEVGVLTNLAHDHLEFHKTIGKYARAKAKLFSNSKVSILNKKARHLKTFLSAASGQIILYDPKSEVRATKYVVADGVRQEFEIKLKDGWLKLQTNLLGEYNQEDILAAAKASEVLEVGVDDIKKGIESINGLKGRLEWVSNDRGVRAIVDFAHTQQGMENVLKLVSKHLRKNDEKIIVVFGCNGGRDRTKRAPMGKTACELADMVVVTTEDPRTESVDQIYGDIEKGCVEAGGKLNKTFWRIDDRKEAIDFAINKLDKDGDWILFLGKGHEQSMNIGGVEMAWNEHKIVKKALNKQ